MPKPKTIAIVVAVVIMLNVAIYYWTRSEMANDVMMAPLTPRPRRRAATMADLTFEVDSMGRAPHEAGYSGMI